MPDPSPPENGREPVKPAGTLAFSFLSILTGLVAGLGAVFFRGLIALFHNLLFLGRLSAHYDATLHTPSSDLGLFVILIPVLGAVVVAFLVGTYAPEAKGHGVPEVMEAIHYHRGRMRPIVAVIKSLASALSIGSGGSVGREGPIVQIGASFSATMGEILHLPTWQRITLIAGGAGGGIAATFNTPVGGVLFAVELMLHEVSARTLVPVAISTVTATYIGQLAFGPHPAFVIPALETPYFHVMNPLVFLAYGGLGVLTGAASALFIKTLYGFESLFENGIGGSYYRQHALGMFCVGVMICILMATTGHYYVEGVGYATIQDILSGVRLNFLLLLLLFGLKLLATSLTLGSGASGGVFSPALFMGATLGQAYGIALNFLLPGLTISPVAFAVVGMAGVVGGSTAAAITAIVMIFEMTLDYRVVIPMTLTVAVSYGVRRALVRDSIYTRKLRLRGHSGPEALQANVNFDRVAETLMNTRLETIAASETVSKFKQRAATDATDWFVAEGDDGKILGLVPKDIEADANTAPATRIADVARRDFCVVTEDMPLSKVAIAMRGHDAAFALVSSNRSASPGRITGLITKSQVVDAVVEALAAFEDVEGWAGETKPAPSESVSNPVFRAGPP
jgi:CIC family chloride channel protein